MHYVLRHVMLLIFSKTTAHPLGKRHRTLHSFVLRTAG